MSDPKAFVDACLGSPVQPITDAGIPYFTRTEALRDQLGRIAEVAAALHQVEALREDVTAILRREIAMFNALNLAEVARQRGISFDA